jgi:hypothetical protein
MLGRLWISRLGVDKWFDSEIYFEFLAACPTATEATGVNRQRRTAAVKSPRVPMSELFPAKTIAIEVLGCTDPSREGEFNQWYDKVRVPELRAIRGIVDVYRYRDMQPDLGELGARWSAPPGKPVRYLTVYRINTVDAWALMQDIKENDRKQAASGRGIDCMECYEVSVWEFVAYRRSILPPVRPETRLPDGMPEILLVVFGGMDPSKKLEHDDWWLHTHAHDLLETPGMVQCHRYLTLNPAPAEQEPNLLNLYEFDMDNPGVAFLKILQDDKSIRRVQGRFSNFSRPVKAYGSGLYQHWDLM